MSILVMAVGLNPMRILRVAESLDPVEILALTNPQTEHLLPEVEAALLHLGSPARVTPVPADAYRFDLTLGALHAVARQRQSERAAAGDTWHWIIGGGTKPMIAAQVVAASQDPRGTLWSLDDRAGGLVGADGTARPLPEPARNLTPELLARLHAGLDAQTDLDRGADPDPEHATRQIQWLLERLHAPGHIQYRESSQEIGFLAEGALVALMGAVVPPDHDVHGSITVPLRDPSVPTTPAVELLGGRRAVRRFEVDGLVIRGTQAWVIENKFANLRPQEARIAAAELNARRRHLAGDSAIGILVMLDDAVGQRFDDYLPEFELGGVRVLTRRALIEAAEAVLGKGDVTHTQLGSAFYERWGGSRP